MPHPLWSPVRSALRAAVHLACHVALAALIIIGIRALELLMAWLWQVPNPLLFDALPLKWMFHAMDVGVLLVFGFYGIISVARAFKEPPA
jgi:hypothetical protein